MRKSNTVTAAGCLALAAAVLAAPNPQLRPTTNVTPHASGVPERVPVTGEALPVTAQPSPRPLTLAKVAPALLIAQGQVTAVVRLTDPPLTVAVGKNAKKLGAKIAAAGQRAIVAGLLKKQESIVAAVTQSGGKINARLTKALNAVVVTVDATVLPALARNASVATIRPLADYEMDLSETVPQIGAASLHTAGVDGTGIRVAVLDSGIDYAHAEFGGPGTAADYEAAYGTGLADARNTTRDGLFPTAKVVEGYDFVGEQWPRFAGDTELNPDPDPIDTAYNPDGNGHGTHVADIIAGASGVAPGAKLYAVKVCSAVASACSGVAILEGLDYAADPDGDDDISDAVDVVNMSLGTAYGQIQDDSVLAVQNLVDLGIVVAISAGNDGDKPYVVSAASTAAGAISVAQTQVPSAKASILTYTDDGMEHQILNTASVDWAPIDHDVPAAEVVAVGDACAALSPGSLNGKFALIDRGNCNVSLKVDAAATAGAVGVIIADNKPEDPPTFSFGGGTTFVPTIIITQSDGQTLKDLLAAGHAVTVSLSPSAFTSLAGSVVSTSARGPDSSTQTIKPDIGAPGASVSAVVGTGTGKAAFGGTSGAAPMVSGSAALVLQAFPGLLPYEVKARLMNNAERNILLNPVTLPGVLAPITRIGAGEIRVDRAVAATTIAFDAGTLVPSLSFGYRGINGAGVVNTFRRTIAIRNLGSTICTYAAANSFRYADDEVSGAISVSFAPASVTVPAGGTGHVRMTLTVDGTKLPDWGAYLNGGDLGGSGEGLRKVEYDGYVTFTCEDQTVALPWQMLPRKAADVRPTSKQLVLVGDPGEESAALTLKNTLGSMAGTTEVFDLLGDISPLDYPSPAPPGSDYTLSDLKSFGARVFVASGQYYLQFAVATYGEPAEPNYPALFDVEIDVGTDGDPHTALDGVADYAVFNAEKDGFAASGQNVTEIYDYAADTSVTTAYTDCDLDSGVVVMTVPLAGLGVPDLGYPLNIVVYAIDDYFTGYATDLITDGPYQILYTPGAPRFYVSGPPGSFGVTVPQGGTTSLPVTHSNLGDVWSPSQHGLMLFHRQAAPKRWSDAVTIQYGPPQ